MRNKIHSFTYFMQCPSHWWSRKQKIWVSGNEDLDKYLPFSSTRIFKTKTKALAALSNVKHIQGAFVQCILNLKNKHILMTTWTNR